MTLETIGRAQSDLLPGPSAASLRHRIIDDATADGHERCFATKDEAIARSRDHRLVEDDARGRARARPERAANGHDSRTHVSRAEVKAKLRARTQGAAGARQNFD